jgi:hypothetical protein
MGLALVSPAPIDRQRCTHCGVEKPQVEFYDDSHLWCRQCRNADSRRYRILHQSEIAALNKRWRIDHAPQLLWRNARARASKRGLPFDLEPSDIFIPEHCPVLGIRLRPCSGRMHPANATIDRVVPALGYVKGNIAVISWRANCLKRDARVDELEHVAAWMRAIGKETEPCPR